MPPQALNRPQQDTGQGPAPRWGRLDVTRHSEFTPLTGNRISNHIPLLGLDALSFEGEGRSGGTILTHQLPPALRRDQAVNAIIGWVTPFFIDEWGGVRV